MEAGKNTIKKSIHHYQISENCERMKYEKTGSTKRPRQMQPKINKIDDMYLPFQV